jgi:hypothetical protein
LDHSPHGGLMHASKDATHFSWREKKILRGIKP